ncbi:hypothetical protein L9F63_018417 [Diploptera punctata]|uniref:Ionotropic glutamate receptor C-terminal domain-containing protein n=1 Tax=Diploptera punctata TaxID=6984 RepID=A0AAD8EFA9_DIPPU|nr:hypothetical protein L9F63_018417 [Diploptera punctata]
MGKSDIAFSATISRGRHFFDVTYGYHSDTTAWYVPCGMKYSRWQSISRMFKASLWLTLFITILLAIFFIVFLGRHTQESSTYKSLVGSLSHACAVMVGVSVSQKPKSMSLRCFFFAWICYSLAVDTVFQAYLTTFLVDPGVKHHIRSMMELLKSGMLLGVSDSDIIFFNDSSEIFRETILKRRINCKFNISCFIWASKYYNISLVSTQMWYNEVSADINRHTLCRINDGDLEHSSIVMMLQKGSHFLNPINKVIEAIVQSGIFQHWITMTYYSKKIVKHFLKKHSDNDYHQLNLEHMQSSFYILVLGYLLSILVLIFECVHYSITRM